MSDETESNVDDPEKKANTEAPDQTFRPGIFTGPTECKCGKLMMAEGLYGRYECPECQATQTNLNFIVSFKVLFVILVVLWFALILKQAELYIIGIFAVAIALAFLLLKDDVLKEKEMIQEQWDKWEADGKLVGQKVTQKK